MNVIYHLQFGFRQKHSTSNALIDSNDKIREQLDKGNFTCKIFVDLQNFFDTVDHDILIQKLNHYGIRRVANNCFFSYLQYQTQYGTYPLWCPSRFYSWTIIVFDLYQ